MILYIDFNRFQSDCCVIVNLFFWKFICIFTFRRAWMRLNAALWERPYIPPVSTYVRHGWACVTVINLLVAHVSIYFYDYAILQFLLIISLILGILQLLVFAQRSVHGSIHLVDINCEHFACKTLSYTAKESYQKTLWKEYYDFKLNAINNLKIKLSVRSFNSI